MPRRRLLADVLRGDHHCRSCENGTDALRNSCRILVPGLAAQEATFDSPAPKCAAGGYTDRTSIPSTHRSRTTCCLRSHRQPLLSINGLLRIAREKDRLKRPPGLRRRRYRRPSRNFQGVALNVAIDRPRRPVTNPRHHAARRGAARHPLRRRVTAAEGAEWCRRPDENAHRMAIDHNRLPLEQSYPI